MEELLNDARNFEKKKNDLNNDRILSFAFN